MIMVGWPSSIDRGGGGRRYNDKAMPDKSRTCTLQAPDKDMHTAGTSGLAGGPCSACEAGKYKAAAGSAACSTCARHSGVSRLACSMTQACHELLAGHGAERSSASLSHYRQPAAGE